MYVLKDIGTLKILSRDYKKVPTPLFIAFLLDINLLFKCALLSFTKLFKD